jgi:hypothetical protein
MTQCNMTAFCRLRFFMLPGLSLLLSLSLSAPAQATALDPELAGPPQQTVVLLTSLDFGNVPLFLRVSMFHNYENRLERRFREAFENRGYRLKVVHRADQHALWTALQDPLTVGLFWLGHGAGQSGGAGLGSEGVLMDAEYLNVLPALQGIHPNLRFLAVVGCKNEAAVEAYFRRWGIRARNPRFVFKGFSGTVDAQAALQSALRVGQGVLNRSVVRRGYSAPCVQEPGWKLRVVRRLSDGYLSLSPESSSEPTRPEFRRMPALRVELRDRVLGVLPRAWNGARQEAVLSLPLRALGEEPEATDLKLIGNIGQNLWRPDRPLELGRLEFQAPWAGALWQLFARPDGSPIGVTHHIYRYRGTLDFEVEPELLEPFACQNMPARAD